AVHLFDHFLRRLVAVGPRKPPVLVLTTRTQARHIFQPVKQRSQGGQSVAQKIVNRRQQSHFCSIFGNRNRFVFLAPRHTQTTNFHVASPPKREVQREKSNKTSSSGTATYDWHYAGRNGRGNRTIADVSRRPLPTIGRSGILIMGTK